MSDSGQSSEGRKRKRDDDSDGGADQPSHTAFERPKKKKKRLPAAAAAAPGPDDRKAAVAERRRAALWSQYNESGSREQYLTFLGTLAALPAELPISADLQALDALGVRLAEAVHELKAGATGAGAIRKIPALAALVAAVEEAAPALHTAARRIGTRVDVTLHAASRQAYGELRRGTIGYRPLPFMKPTTGPQVFAVDDTVMSKQKPVVMANRVKRPKRRPVQVIVPP